MIEVLRCGALTTIQDLGRPGLRHLGVSQAGALDPIAMQQANLLLGNAHDAAVMEISVGPLVLRFVDAVAIALTGVDFGAIRGESAAAAESLPPGYGYMMNAGDILTLSRPSVPGARCYLAVGGGIDVPSVLGSRSTDITGGFGGFAGRALVSGDKLVTRLSSPQQTILKQGIRSRSPSHVLRVLPGPDYDLFTLDSRQRFFSQPWGISHHSNRMGLRLKGGALEYENEVNLLSAGVLPGDVQVPPDGQPIVLANDAQTTGGYPRIASVIQSDMWQLAHLPPLTSVYFLPATLREAQEAKERQQHYLERLQIQVENSAHAH